MPEFVNLYAAALKPVSVPGSTLYLQLCSINPLKTQAIGTTGSGPHSARSKLKEHAWRWMLAALAVFLSCHLVLVLHRGVHLDIALLHKFRSLQVAGQP